MQPSADGGATPARHLADHSADRRLIFLALCAGVIGLGSALGAWALIRLIDVATNLFWFGRVSVGHVEIPASNVGLLVLAIPAIGGLLVGLMARFGSERIRGHGIPEAIETILYGESRLSLKVAILKPISSAISIGSGGPFGAEGPIIMTGGAVGSLFAQRFRLSAAERKTLLVAGAAGGMTAIFGTPIAAVLLALEVLLFEWKPRSLIPVIVAALAALAFRPFLIGSGPMFPVAAHLGAADGAGLATALALGCIVGLEALLLSTLLYRVEDVFHRLPVHWMWWPAIGGVAVGVGGMIDLHVLGAGYGNIQALLDGSLSFRVVLALAVVKALVWLISLGSGTSGGVLAPLLILGGALGYLFGLGVSDAPGTWALLAMAGIIAGAMRAPLTGALFAAELTGQFATLPAALASAGGAYAVSVLFMRRSILTEKIARRGRHILQEYVVDPLQLIQAGQIMSRAPEVLPAELPVAEAVAFFQGEAVHRSYPVVDTGHRLVGLVSRSDALRWQTVEGEWTTLGDVLSDASQPFAFPESTIGEVADLMLDSGVGRIPIVNGNDHRVVGILSRQDLLKARSSSRRSETVAR